MDTDILLQITWHRREFVVDGKTYTVVVCKTISWSVDVKAMFPIHVGYIHIDQRIQDNGDHEPWNLSVPNHGDGYNSEYEELSDDYIFGHDCINKSFQEKAKDLSKRLSFSSGVVDNAGSWLSF